MWRFFFCRLGVASTIAHARACKRARPCEIVLTQPPSLPKKIAPFQAVVFPVLIIFDTIISVKYDHCTLITWIPYLKWNYYFPYEWQPWCEENWHGAFWFYSGPLCAAQWARESRKPLKSQKFDLKIPDFLATQSKDKYIGQHVFEFFGLKRTILQLSNMRFITNLWWNF